MWLALIHESRYLYVQFRSVGIKAMSRGISEGKQVIKFASMSYRSWICLFSQKKRTINIKSCKLCRRVKFWPSFTSLMHAVRTSMLSTASKNVTMITSTHNLPLASSRQKVLHFLLNYSYLIYSCTTIAQHISSYFQA